MASIALRPYESRDRGFVIMSFVRSYGRSAYAVGVPAQVLIDLLEPLLIVWNTTVAEAPDGELLGWICALAPGAVAWVFVKPEFRRKHLARALLDGAGVGKSILTPFMPTKGVDEETSFHSFTKRRGYSVHFRPYLPLVSVSDLARGT